MDETSQSLAMAEWEAWRNMCSRLDDIGVNINNDDRLAELIRLWGDSLVELKVHNRFTRQAG